MTLFVNDMVAIFALTPGLSIVSEFYLNNLIYLFGYLAACFLHMLAWLTPNWIHISMLTLGSDKIMCTQWAHSSEIYLNFTDISGEVDIEVSSGIYVNLLGRNPVESMQNFYIGFSHEFHSSFINFFLGYSCTFTIFHKYSHSVYW